MFDDLETKNENNLNVNTGGGVREEDKIKDENINEGEKVQSDNPQGIAEDIFSDGGSDLISGEETETSFNGGKEKPEIFRGVQKSEDGANLENNENSSFPFFKIIVIFIVVVIIAGGAYFTYSKHLLDYFFKKNVVNEELEKKNIEEKKNVEENNYDENKTELDSDLNNNEGNKEDNNETMDSSVKEDIDTEEIDTDGDGLSDQLEISIGTNINSIDTDGDGLFDKEEVEVYKTDPKNKDTDGDGFMDGAEVKDGYNPNGPGKLYDINE